MISSKSTLLINAAIVLENDILDEAFILVENGIIAKIDSMDHVSEVNSDKTIDLKGKTVIPGFIDIHIHGAGGSDTMDATPDALQTIASTLPREGTTSFLATTITQAEAAITSALKNVAVYRGNQNKPGEAEILGVHLEGPFINPGKKGAQPEVHIVDPNIALFNEWQDISDNAIKLVTIAPERDGGTAFIEHLSTQNVIASIGHSDATFEEMKLAIKAGAKQVTHLFNGMRGLHHREPGVAGAALLFDELKAEIIADGIHVHPDMINLAVKAKGAEGIILITDSMRAKCLKSGQYDLGGQEVTVADGKAVLANGSLAGSILKMIDAFTNLQDYSNLSIHELIQLASANAAKQIGVYDRKGSIAVGKDADLVVLDQELTINLTLCRGKIAYEQ